MRIIKRMLAVFLAVMVSVSLTPGVFAADGPGAPPADPPAIEEGDIPIDEGDADPGDENKTEEPSPEGISVFGVVSAMADTHNVGNSTQLTNALATAGEGDTILILNDFVYDGAISFPAKSLIIDVNGKHLTVGNNYMYGIEVESASLTVTDSSPASSGMLTVKGSLTGILAGLYYGDATVVVDCAGEIIVSSGNIDPLNGIQACGAGSSVTFAGPISINSSSEDCGEVFFGVSASEGARVSVTGDISVTTSSKKWGTAVGVEAIDGSSVSVIGNVSAECVANALGGEDASAAVGVGAYGSGSSVAISGNVSAQGGIEENRGAGAFFGGTVTIDGGIFVPAGSVYVKTGSVEKTPGQGVPSSTKPGFFEYTDGTSTIWVKANCEIVGGDKYIDIGAAIATVGTGGAATIRLLMDIDYNGGLVVNDGRTITFDLNGFILNVINNAGHALDVRDNSEVKLEGDGELNVKSTYSSFASGVLAEVNSKARVTSAIGSSSGVVAYNNSHVTVDGDVSASFSYGQTYGVYAYTNASTVTIGGDVYANCVGGRNYGAYATAGCSISIAGSVTAINDATISSAENLGVYAYGSGSSVTVAGDVTATGRCSTTYGAYANNGGTVEVTGDVSADNDNCFYSTCGVNAGGSNESSVIVGGNVSASGAKNGSYTPQFMGVNADGFGTTVTVGGDVYVTSDALTYGVSVFFGTLATIGGDVSAAGSGIQTYGVYADGNNATGNIKGNVSSVGVTNNHSVRVQNGGKITIDGGISVSAGGSYITLGITARDPAVPDSTTSFKEGYAQYSNYTPDPNHQTSSTVWLKQKCEITQTGVKYFTLDAALAAAATGQTIKMLDDIVYEMEDEEDQVTINKDITFDLNGKIIDLCHNSDDGIPLMVTGAGAKLKLLDPSNGELNVTGKKGAFVVWSNAEGTVTSATVTEGEAAAFANTGAKLTITGDANGVDGGVIASGGTVHVGGNVTMTTNDPDGAAVAVRNGGNATVDGEIIVPEGAGYIMLGSTIKQKSDGVVSSVKTGYLEYTDGTNIAWVKTQAHDANTIDISALYKEGVSVNNAEYNWSYNAASNTITVTDDVTVISSSPVTDANRTLDIEIPADVTVLWKAEYSDISAVSTSWTNYNLIRLNPSTPGVGAFEVAAGGNIAATSIDLASAILQYTASVSVSGGSISAGGTGSIFAINNYGDNINVSGGSVTSNNYVAILAGSGDVTISGGLVSSGGNSAAVDCANGNVKVTGGTVTGSGTGANSAAIYKGATGSVTVTGGTVQATGTGTAIVAGGSNSVTVSNGTVSATSGTAISARGSAPITVTGGTVEATTGYAISTACDDDSNASGSITVTGGTVRATGAGGIAISNFNVGEGPTGFVSVTGGTVSSTTGDAIKAGGIVYLSGGTISTTTGIAIESGQISVDSGAPTVSRTGTTGSNPAVKLASGAVIVVDGSSAELTVNGNVEVSGFGYVNAQTGGILAINGNVIGTGSEDTSVVFADTNGTIYVNGDVTVDVGSDTCTGVYVSGGDVTVTGSVTLTDPNNRFSSGAQAQSSGTIYVYGDVIVSGDDSTGAFALTYSEIMVDGDVTVTGSDAVGANAFSGGEITIDGMITAPIYIQVGSEEKTEDDFTEPTTKPDYLTYTDSTNPSDTSTVWVLDKVLLIPIISITVTGDGGATTITTNGGTLQMNAAIAPANATNHSVTWSVANGTGSASISATGLLTALTNGTVTVRATAVDGSGKYGERVITISGQPEVTGVTVSPSAATVNQGGTYEFTAEVIGTNGPDPDVVWSVEDAAKAGTTISGSGPNGTIGTLTVAADETAETLIVRATSEQDPSKSGTAIVTVVNENELEMITITDTTGNIDNRVLSLTVDDREGVAVDYLPAGVPAGQKGVEWVSSNPEVAKVFPTGAGSSDEIWAINPGSASIAAISKHNGGEIYDYIWVIVSDGIDPEIKIVSKTAGVVINKGKIEESFFKGGTFTLATEKTADNEPVAVAWKSSDTKVATVSASGVVKQIAPGTAVITATGKNAPYKNVPATVAVTFKDIVPRLPVSTITLYTKSDGAGFTVLPTNTFKFDDLKIEQVVQSGKKVDLKGNFEIVPVNATNYILKTDLTVKGKYVVDLQSVNGGANVGERFKLTVNVVTDVPKPTVKMPALNTFWKNASGQISVTGKNLPEISKVVLVDSATPAKDGMVTQNFTVTPSGLITAATFTSNNNAKPPKTAVKGRIEVYYEGFSETIMVPITVNLKPKAPKLTLGSGTQTIHPAHGLEASFEVKGGEVESVSHSKAQTVFSDPVVTGNNVKLTLTGHDPNKAQSFTGQLHVMLKGAGAPILIKPVVKTVKANAATTYKLSTKTVTLNSTLDEQSQTVTIIPNHANKAMTHTRSLKSGNPDGIIVEGTGESIKISVDDANRPVAAKTVKINVYPDGTTNALELTVNINTTAQGSKGSSLSASVKADKANINYMDQVNTMQTYKPTIKGTTSAIKDVKIIKGLNPPLDNRNDSGEDLFKAYWNEAANKIEVRTVSAEYTYQKNFSYKMRFEIELDGGSKLTTGNVTIKPAQTTVKHAIPKSTVMHQGRTGIHNYVKVDLKAVTPGGAKINTFELKSNPKGAYCYFLDANKQELHLWITDSSLVKPGKATLTFSVSYKGQAQEKVGGVYTVKPINVKVPLNILR